MQVAVGSTVAYGVRGPRIQPALKAACVFFMKITAKHNFWHRLQTYCSA